MQIFIFFIAFLFYLYVPTKRAMHMYQQNRYNLRRYVRWLQDTISRSYQQIFKTLISLTTSYGLLFVASEKLPMILLTMLVFIYAYISFKIEDDNVYRKPLVYTNRIKRLCIFFYALYSVLLFLLYETMPTPFTILMTPFLYFIPWILLLVCARIMLPIENHIRSYFIKDAKHRLRQRSDVKVIGVTGSYGKTSVKNIMNAFLAEKYYPLMTPHSYNNLMGITITIRNYLQPLHELFLCEMGADHVGEIRELMEFVEPKYGVVTAVGPQHLQTFKSMQNILHEKMQMIEKLPVDGVGFLNKDNAYISTYKIKNSCRIVWFGKDSTSDYCVSKMKYSREGSSFSITHEEKTHDFTSRLLGEHNIMNICCAIAVAHHFGVDWDTLIMQSERLPFVEHRLQLIEDERFTILDNAYNSNPEGAYHALEVLAQMDTRRIIVTPGMIDLGKQQEAENKKFGMHMAQCADEIILVGKLQTKPIYEGLLAKHYPLPHIHIVNSIQEAFAILTNIARKSDVVLLENDLPDAFNH